MDRHLSISGECSRDRMQLVPTSTSGVIVARCHRRRSGPYSGIDTILRALLPELTDRWPDLVERHRVELLQGIPDLESLLGPAPSTLASAAPFRERTRFFGTGMIRCLSQGMVTLLLEYARRVRDAGSSPALLVLDDIDDAEPTTQEFVALLLRRADPAVLPVVVCGREGNLPPELEAALADADQRDAPPTAAPARAHDDDLVAQYVQTDGTADDPALLEAYLLAEPGLRRALHDERAQELERAGGWGALVGAIPYHRERGSDPGGAGRRALLAAQQLCVEAGFSAAVVDLGERGRAVTDPVRQPDDFLEFTKQAAAALVPLGRLDESVALYREMLQRSAAPRVHMNTSYAMAMMHTRFLTPRNHDRALQWQNTAVAIASVLPDEADRLVAGVFHDNALALIEMHRGNLQHALELIEAGMGRLDSHLQPDQWALHRSQLLYNRARLLSAMGRLDDAATDYSTLVDLDPYYTDYLSERAKVARLNGRLDLALEDYDRAVELAPPFPELYYNRGTARAEVGDLDGALADFGYVLDMEPDDIDTRLSRAELLLSEGDLDGVEADVRAGLSLRPDEPRLHCMLGTLHLERQAWSEAVTCFERALAEDPRYPAALVNRAFASFELGRSGAAVDDLTLALDLVGEDPDLLLNRGIAHAANGSTQLAMDDYTRALALPGADIAELERHRERCLTSGSSRSLPAADGSGPAGTAR